MKKNSFLISVLIYALFCVVYYSQSTYHRRARLIRYFISENQGKHIQKLFLGDSHMAYAIKNKYLNENSLSLAYPGNSIDNFIIYYQYLIDNNYSIDTILIEAGNHLFVSRRQGVNSLIGHQKFFNSLEIIKAVGYRNFIKVNLINVCPFILESTPNAIKKFFQHPNELFMRRSADPNSKDKLDFNQKKQNFDSNRIKINRRKATLYENIETKISYKKFLYLINQISKRNTKIILTNMPVHSLIHEKQSFESLKKHLVDKNFKISYLDLTRLVDDKQFRDIDHIKIEYSKSFSENFSNFFSYCYD